MLGGRWNSETSQLRLELLDDLGSDTPLSFEFTGANGVQLPLSGVQENQARLTITVEPSLGSTARAPAAPVPINQSPGVLVGEFSATSIGYTPALANRVADIAIGFTYSYPIEAGDVLTLTLTGVIGLDLDTAVVLPIDGADAALFDKLASEWVGAVAELRLVAGEDIAADKAVWVTIREASGLKLPITGAARNSPEMTIALAGGGSTGHEVAIEVSDSVVVLSGLSLSFTPAEPGAPTAVTLALTCSTPLPSGDKIVVVLPAFTGPDVAQNLALGGTDGSGDSEIPYL